MPYSPKASLVPPLAAPVRLGWCCLRNLILRGTNTAQPSCPDVSAGAGALAATSAGAISGALSAGTAWTGTPTGRVPSGLLGRTLGTRTGHIPLVDPHLDPDPAERGFGLMEAVIDVSSQGVERHLPFPV